MLKLAISLVTIATLVFIGLLLLAWWGQERLVFQPPRDVPVPDLRATRVEFASDDGVTPFRFSSWWTVAQSGTGDRRLELGFLADGGDGDLVDQVAAKQGHLLRRREELSGAFYWGPQ